LHNIRVAISELLKVSLDVLGLSPAEIDKKGIWVEGGGYFIGIISRVSKQPFIVGVP
jgi:hypothetical protein